MNAEELRIIITAEIDQLRRELQNARDEVEDFGDDAKASFSDFNDAAQKVGDVSKNILKIVATSILAIGAALVALSASSKEYRSGQAQLITSFEHAGKSAEDAKKTYNELYRVLGDDKQSVEAAQNIARLTSNQKELEQWTKICQGAFALYGDTIPVETLTESVVLTSQMGEVSGPLEDVLLDLGYSVEEVNDNLWALNTEEERSAYIQSLLAPELEKAAELHEENAAAVLAENEAQLKLQEAQAKLGEAMVPVNTMLSEFGAIFMEQIAPVIEEFIAENGPKMAETLTNVAKAIGEVLIWLSDNWEMVSTIGTIILTVASALSVFATTMAIVNAVMAASPVTWIVLGIVAAITALIAIIVIVVKYWDEIKAAALKAWEAIKQAWNDVANWFNTKIVQPIVNFFTGLWNKITNGARSAWEGIKNVFSSVTNWFKDVFTKAWQGVKNVFSTGGKIFTGIKEGISNVFKTVVNGIIGGINTVIAVPFNAINRMLSKLRGIEILGVSPFGWISTFSVPQIPKLAQGGIVDNPTLAMIGEQGKEAVVPLENNTEWIDKLVAKLSKAQGGGRPIVLKVDKRVLGQVSAEGINDITKLTGSIPLVIA